MCLVLKISSNRAAEVVWKSSKIFHKELKATGFYVSLNSFGLAWSPAVLSDICKIKKTGLEEKKRTRIQGLKSTASAKRSCKRFICVLILVQLGGSSWWSNFFSPVVSFLWKNEVLCAGDKWLQGGKRGPRQAPPSHLYMRPWHKVLQVYDSMQIMGNHQKSWWWAPYVVL